MNPIETISAGGYNAFYALSVVTALCVAFVSGRRRGWRSTAWGAVVVAWVTGGVIGAMVPHLLFGDAVAAKTSLGAIGGAGLALLAAAAWLRLPIGQSFDNTAVAIPLGAAIVRIGCFIAGCCHGTPTSLPFGVRHDDSAELIHPVQLYESALYLLLAALLLRPGRRLRSEGSLALAAVAGIGVIRFTTEFVRDSAPVLGVLSLAQLVVAPVAIVAVAWLVHRESKPSISTVQYPSRDSIGRVLPIFGAVVFAALAVSGALSPLERAVLLLSIAGCGLAFVHRLRSRVAPVGIAALALQAPAILRDSTGAGVFYSFGGGATAGAFTHTHVGENCEGQEIERWTRKHSYLIAGLEGGLRREVSRTHGAGLRGRVFAGHEDAGATVVTNGSPSQPGAYELRHAGVTLIGDADWKWLGLSVGGSIGNVPVLVAGDEPRYPNNSFPAAAIRLGRLDRLSGEIRVGDHAPGPSPVGVVQLGLGFGDSLGNRTRIGVSDAGLYYVGRILRPSGLELSPYIALGPVDDINGLNIGLMVRKWYVKK